MFEIQRQRKVMIYGFQLYDAYLIYKYKKPIEIKF